MRSMPAGLQVAEKHGGAALSNFPSCGMFWCVIIPGDIVNCWSISINNSTLMFFVSDAFCITVLIRQMSQLSNSPVINWHWVKLLRILNLLQGWIWHHSKRSHGPILFSKKCFNFSYCRLIYHFQQIISLWNTLLILFFSDNPNAWKVFERFSEYKFLSLPPAHVVWREVMFSQACVCSGGERYSISIP